MIMHDLNQDKEIKVLMIHPMMSCAEGFQICLTPWLGDGYRYLMPDLNGHGDAIKETYVSAEAEARQIHDYLIGHGCSRIRLAYCASLGGCAMFKLLQYPDLTFDHIFFEGASLYEKAPFLEWFIGTIYISEHRKAAKDPVRTAKKLAGTYGEIAGEAMTRRFSGINEESIRGICHDCANVELIPLSEEIQKKCVFAYGEKDFDLKNTQKQLPKHYPKAELKVWKGFDHCTRLTKDSEAYAAMLKQYL